MEIFSSLPVNTLLFFTMYFEVFLLVTYFEELPSFSPEQTPVRMPGKHPTVTIIVPAWNEGLTLLGTIESLLALDYPKDRLMLFIVDDGSTDDTLKVAQTYADNPQVRIFSKENGGKYTALNLGIEVSKSELIGCLDADSYVDSKALLEIIPFFDSPKVMAVTPSVQIHKPDNMLRRMQAAEYMIGEFTRKLFSRIDGLYVTPGPFSIYRRSIFKKIGGFVHAYNTEDMEMALRMQSHRMKIENAHNAVVFTVSPRTPHALYKQRVRWVSGFLKNAFFNYRHMFFNKKYGNLGMLTMPFAFISIFVALSFTALWMKGLLHMLYVKYLQYSAMGIHLTFSKLNFDWFSLNLEFRRLVIYMMFFATVFFLLIGARMLTKKWSFTRNMLYFILLYGLIAPFWLARSLFNFLTARDAKWR